MCQKKGHGFESQNFHNKYEVFDMLYINLKAFITSKFYNFNFFILTFKKAARNIQTFEFCMFLYDTLTFYSSLEKLPF